MQLHLHGRIHTEIATKRKDVVALRDVCLRIKHDAHPFFQPHHLQLVLECLKTGFQRIDYLGFFLILVLFDIQRRHQPLLYVFQCIDAELHEYGYQDDAWNHKYGRDGQSGQKHKGRIDTVNTIVAMAWSPHPSEPCVGGDKRDTTIESVIDKQREICGAPD